jgi:hypothetical protein
VSELKELNQNNIGLKVEKELMEEKQKFLEENNLALQNRKEEFHRNYEEIKE